MIDLLKTLLEWLEEGRPVTSVTILAHEGSTPRSAGSKMLVREDGTLAGTVGGGLVEARVLEAAARVLEDGRRIVLEFDLGGELAAGADLICGGALNVFLERIDPGGEASLYAELLRRVEGGQRCLLAIPADGGGRTLVLPKGPTIGAGGSERWLEDVREAGRGIRTPVVFTTPEGNWFLEPWAAPSPLVIAGAGHVSRPTAQIAAQVGFQVTVLDDRPEFANAWRFPQAHEIRVQDLGVCLDGLDIGPEASLVIVTRGHVHDAAVLAQALRTSAGYIGMIGSRRKREAVYQALRKQGFGDADFARVHCPVGLAIGAETPEEIAVSIVAQLIAARAARSGT